MATSTARTYRITMLLASTRSVLFVNGYNEPGLNMIVRDADGKLVHLTPF